MSCGREKVFRTKFFRAAKIKQLRCWVHFSKLKNTFEIFVLCPNQFIIADDLLDYTIHHLRNTLKNGKNVRHLTELEIE